ncbi:uncharacterized protein [Solanum tuberosum]|uniref:uncharacterized protein n=1 Tax=Solanum tuberosum TaxID=4113 RepID=UPI00073A39FE|nr:PREDICTED: uncharacterized protein LOC107062863 [Solanum tuberosum]
MITTGKNEEIGRVPNIEEVKHVVFNLNGDSTSRPDDFLGIFFQSCWDIIREDIIRMVKAFFCGQELPRFVTHTNLILLPKRENVKSLTDLRPVSLCTFVSKIISRVLHERIATVLPCIISKNQSGFVKGRSITENVLLAQEIIRDINLRKKFHNVVVKLDMAKGYDRVSWVFLTKVLRRFGFSEIIIDMVWRLLTNNWYSVMVNGKAFGFFQSSRGLKQGDPLSLTLFIISAEVLARGLNKLHEEANFKGYRIPKWSPPINHLSYADDTILFCLGDKKSIGKMVDVLKKYEMVSGQVINLNKSIFYLHDKTPLIVGVRLRSMTEIRHGNFPFTYLGCPVYYGRKKKAYFEELVKKSFFGSKTGGGKGKHWLAWEDMCYPKEEGGIGFRSLHEITKALFGKLWWTFRTSTSLWSNFMWNKYCKKHHPLIAKGTGASHVWRKMLEVTEEVDHYIWWQIKIGETSFWFDNWTKQGALYYIEDQNVEEEEVEETMIHLFLIAPIATKLWKQFTTRAGIRTDGGLQQIITWWWKATNKPKLKTIFQAIPAILMWELWKRRNARRNGKEVTYGELYQKCQNNVFQRTKTLLPWINVRKKLGRIS